MKGDSNCPKCSPCGHFALDCQWILAAGTAAALEAPIFQLSQLSSASHHKAGYTSTEHPESALQDQEVAKLFHYYIASLALWYDLSDSKHHFKDVVPIRAWYNSLLLSAILAFAAANQHRTLGGDKYLDIAEFYHYDSVWRLISLRHGTGSGWAGIKPLADRPIGFRVSLATTQPAQVPAKMPISSLYSNRA